MLYIYDNIRDVLVIILEMYSRLYYSIIFETMYSRLYSMMHIIWIIRDAYYTMIPFFLIDCMHSNLNTKLSYLSSGLVK